MKKCYPIVQVILLFLLPFYSTGQDCSLLQASCATNESRCAATGSIIVTASGGSGSYKYRVSGPVNTNFTTLDSITGLSAGVYDVTVNDIVTNCTITIPNVTVAGSYQDPRFNLAKVDVSCENASNGIITAVGQQYGRAPFVYRIVSPSPMGVGTQNSTGVFTGLAAGNYSIRLTDSCGGIQTRIVTILNYTWRIDAYPFTKTSCDEATGFIRVIDSRGNISTVSGIPDFMYGVVRSPGDTLWQSSPNFSFTLLGSDRFDIVAKDGCGIIKRGSTSVSFRPSVGASVNMYGYQCNSFNAAVVNVVNFFNPNFCLFRDGNLVSCNSTGVFTNIPYGNYCIEAHDACTDTTITRCFNANQPPVNVASEVTITDKTCYEFTAMITGQVGLTNPEYCLFDSIGNQLDCNNTGVFTNLTYALYCIQIRDGCVDTTLQRCFAPTVPTPVMNPVIPGYISCNNFGVVVTGDSLTNPLYCIYDENGVQIACNNTGVFDSIPLGSYCFTIHDECFDTTLIDCIIVEGPNIRDDLAAQLSNQRCSTFTATVTSQNGNIAEYCLYDASDNLVACNTTGVFDDIAYGSYCVKATIACPDTLIDVCFTARGAIPSVDNNVSVSNKTCTGFTAAVTGFVNLTNPQFCLFNNSNTLVGCNSTGTFVNIPYGNYCIQVTDGCYDTTIVKCFTSAPTPVDLTITASPSCSYGYAQVNIGMGGAVLPVNIRIYYQNGTLLLNQNYNSNNIIIDSIPGTTSGAYYKIVATDNCGNKDSLNRGATASYFDHSPTVEPKCPGGLWPDGSGNIVQYARTNMGSVTVRVVKKNGVNISPVLVPNSVSGNYFRFNDLGPGVYIIRVRENTCNRNLYDTITINNYEYPNLDRSSAYQCDVNGFSVSAVASYGVAPFRYEIIGSVPASPSLVTGQQSSSIFNINNGASYSLIRLRAVDACGNATLGDASILPLANNGIIASNNCFLSPTTLSVDSIYNATYAWYRKDSINGVDSILIGNASSVYVPNLTIADTGIYVCYLVVNSGCIRRTYYYDLDGNCFPLLPVSDEATLTGRLQQEKHLLNWRTAAGTRIEEFIIEHKTADGSFRPIGQLNANPGITANSYQFDAGSPGKGYHFYRLKMRKQNGSSVYSNTVTLGGSKAAFSIYPNPVQDLYQVQLNASIGNRYRISLLSGTGQLIESRMHIQAQQGVIQLRRPSGLQNGVYYLQVWNESTQEQITQKIIFL